LHPYKEQRLVVVGSERMAVFDDVRKDDKLMIYDQGVEFVNGEPVIRKHSGTAEALEPLSRCAVSAWNFYAPSKPERADHGWRKRIARAARA